VIPSILARAVLGGLEAGRLREELETWIEIFYREYYASRELYFSRGEAILDYFENEGWAACEGGCWVATAQGESPLRILSEQTRGVVECYDTLARVLLPWMESAQDGLLRSGLLKEAHLAFESAQILGEARRSEAISDTSFDNALAWLVARQVLESEVVKTGKRKTRDTRFARGEKWTELASGSSGGRTRGPVASAPRMAWWIRPMAGQHPQEPSRWWLRLPRRHRSGTAVSSPMNALPDDRTNRPDEQSNEPC
jgi:hypothetical protein